MASWVAAPADVAGAGIAEWGRVSGMSPVHPLVGGPDVEGLGQFDVNRGRSRIITTPEGQLGPVTGGVMATPDGAGASTVATLEGWRDIFNFRGSPMPWLLIFALIFLGLMQFRVQARAGRGRARASATAALG